MSRSAQGEQSPTDSTYHNQISRQAVQEAIEQIDARLKHLKDSIIPPQPYLLSIPTDCPYRFHKSFVNCWYTGTPFNQHEEELQYMSFHPHQNIGEELLKVVGGWSDAEGNLIDDESHLQSQSESASNTPVQPVARKKISLKDYKTKDKPSQNTPRAEALNKRGKEVMKSDNTLGVSRAEEKDKLRRDSSRKHRNDDAQPLKANKTSMVTPIIREPGSPSPAKRRRLSSDEPRSGDELHERVTHEVSKEKRSLPALLSPTLPAAKSSKTSRSLPSLLSPDLPKSLQVALSEVHPRRTDHVRSVLGDALGTTDKKVIEKHLSEGGRIRSDSQLSIKSLPAGSKTSPSLKPIPKPASRPTTPTANGVRVSPSPRQRHVIILKYGKKNRKNVQSLLRFPPRPRKVRPQRDESPSRRLAEPGKEVQNRPAITPNKAERKRPSEMSPEPVTKKLKAAGDTPDRPRTPTVSMKTPSASNTLKRLDPQATPKKDLKPSAMQRMTSSEGIEAKTPPIDRGRTSTPVGTLPTRASPATGSTPLGRETDRAAWNELNTKYHKLGRQLKGEAQTLAASKSETDQIISAANHIEALLCFMINISAQFHSRVSGPGWETIMPYFIFVFKATRRYRHLHGLVIQLGAICRQVWHNHNIEKLYRDPLPDESNSAPTPGSDGNTKTDDNEKYKRRYLDFKNQLVQNSRELQTAWLEGSRYLSPYLLEHEYPKTWAKRTKDTSRRGVDRVNPAKIDKDFFLPLDPNSTIFEASQFATSLIGEWMEREKVTWKSKIDL